MSDSPARADAQESPDHPWADQRDGPRCPRCHAYLLRFDHETWECVVCGKDYVIRAPRPDKEPTT